VLPFDEFGTGEPGGFGPLGAGFAEDITTELARNRGLPITARHNVFAAKAQGKTPAEIAALFQARYVLEGSIRRLGERVVINAQLIDGRDGHHVWAERYSLFAAELSTIQGELVARIASTLLGEIRVAGYTASLRQPAASLDVQELVWKAIAHLRQTSRDNYVAAHAELERAVALGPTYALGHVIRGYALACDAGMAISGTVGPEALSGAIGTIRRGIELDPLLPVGHQGLSFAQFSSGPFDEALLAAERCVALGPGDALNLVLLGLPRAGVGQYAAALANIEQAMALNPVFPAFFHGTAAKPLYALGRFEEASRNFTAATERCPGYVPGYVWGAAADVALGRKEAAAARVRTLLRHAPWVTARVPVYAVAYTRDPPLRARFVRHLREAGVPGAED
jgi:adenylate cyclase